MSDCLRSLSRILKGTKFVLKRNNDIDEEIKKMKNKVRDTIEKTVSDIRQSKEEKETSIQHFTELEKKITTFEEDYEKLRVKLRGVEARQKQIGDKEEKICKFCKKLFIERENFNWSCRSHLSEWSGENYWCCGTTNQYSPGCQSSKHISNEDADGLNQDKEKHGLGKSEKCRICRKSGHELFNCPKDPNPRSTIQLKIKKKILLLLYWLEINVI